MLLNLKLLNINKFQRHEKLTIILEKEKLLATLRIEKSTMSMEENNT
jgi:hypothetical protein